MGVGLSLIVALWMICLLKYVYSLDNDLPEDPDVLVYYQIPNCLQTYTAFAKDVTDDQARIRRFKKVGLWSLQLAIQAFFMGLAGSYA